jgi:hypothetical protein
MTVTEQNRLRVFERRVLRKIYGPTQDKDGTWIKTNEELENLIKKKNIVRFIKSQTLRWLAHVIRMDTTRTVKKLTEWEPCSSRAVGRPRLRWLDQVEEDLKKKKVRNWREKCKDRRLWNEIVKQAKTLPGLKRQVKKKRDEVLDVLCSVFFVHMMIRSCRPSFGGAWSGSKQCGLLLCT